MVYSICLPAVFRDVPPAEALDAVKEAGYGYFEIWNPGMYGIDTLKAEEERTGLQMVTHGLLNREPLNDPSRLEAYVAALKETIPTAKKLGVTKIISRVGDEVPGLSREVQHESTVRTLKACVPVLEEAEMQLIIEPLNTKTDHPGYFLVNAAEGFDIIREVGDPHVRLLYDMYHQQVTGDFDLKEILENLPLIAHFHLAGYPGRHEPVNDETDYPTALSAIRAAGYEGTVGLEYFPLADPKEEIRRFLRETAR